MYVVKFTFSISDHSSVALFTSKIWYGYVNHHIFALYFVVWDYMIILVVHTRRCIKSLVIIVDS